MHQHSLRLFLVDLNHKTRLEELLILEFVFMTERNMKPRTLEFWGNFSLIKILNSRLWNIPIISFVFASPNISESLLRSFGLKKSVMNTRDTGCEMSVPSFLERCEIVSRKLRPVKKVEVSLLEAQDARWVALVFLRGVIWLPSS